MSSTDESVARSLGDKGSMTSTACPFAYGNFWKCPIKNNEDESQNIKLDKNGRPLIPQPNIHKDDPLVSRFYVPPTPTLKSYAKLLKNWPGICKLCIALQISWIAMIGPMGAAALNPALGQLGRAFGISTVQASYQFAIFLLFDGIGALLVVPLSNVYGRRPVYLFGTLLAGVTNVIAGHCSTWAGIMITRAFNGIGVGSTIAIGVATISDMYWVHERGFYKGIYALFLSNGLYIGHLTGGYIAQHLGWEQCFSIPVRNAPLKLL
jgi:hypothetical protein